MFTKRSFLYYDDIFLSAVRDNLAISTEKFRLRFYSENINYFMMAI